MWGLVEVNFVTRQILIYCRDCDKGQEWSIPIVSIVAFVTKNLVENHMRAINWNSSTCVSHPVADSSGAFIVACGDLRVHGCDVDEKLQVPSRDRILTDITNGELKFSTAFAHAPLARTVVAPESENWSTREEMDASKVLTEMEASKVLDAHGPPSNIATFYKLGPGTCSIPVREHDLPLQSL